MTLNLVDIKLSECAKQNVLSCIESGWISSQGSFVKQFEAEFAGWLGVQHAVATSSGTSALHLALCALGVGHGDEVIVPSYTFIATANAVSYTGAKPVFCDVDPATWCIDTHDVRRCITKKTRAIIPVHINGYPCNMQEILEIALEYGLLVIEDACQALGSSYKYALVGTMGHVGCFSFFANKQLTTGEGGMCVTNSDHIAASLRMLRDHGRSTALSYTHDVIGFNYRMTNLQAAVGIAQLTTLRNSIVTREEIHDLYINRLNMYVSLDRLCKNLQMPINSSHLRQQGFLQSYWLFCIRVPNHEIVIRQLRRLEIEAKPFFIPVHAMRPYKNGFTSIPHCEQLQGVMLPLHKGVTEGEYLEVITEVLSNVLR